MGETANIIIADTLQGLGDGRIQWLSCTRPLSVRNLPIEVQWRGARATCRRPDDCPQRKTGRENSTFRRFSRKGHLYRIGLCGAEYTTEQLRHERATFPISQSYHVPDYRTARAMSPGFEQVEYRLRNTDHHFHRDMLIASTQMLILDFFDFHSHLYGEDNISVQNASIMSRFLNMLENGTFREHREVTYYADCLCVTSKYLSEVSKKVSGYTANYWINRYTTLDISRLLRDKSLTFVRISDMFGFSSPAYFSRYVQQHLGVNPTKYRG